MLIVVDPVWRADPVRAPVAAEPAFVRAAGATETKAAASLTIPIASTAGDLLVLTASVSSASNAAITSVTDSAGNQWVKVGAATMAGHTSDGEMWFAGATDAVTSVTLHTSSRLVVAAEIQEFSGVSGVDILAGAAGLGTSAVSGSATPTSVPAVAVGFVAGYANAQTITPTAAFVNQAQQTSITRTAATIASLRAGYLVEGGSAAAQKYAGTFPSSMYWAAGVAFFTASAPPTHPACGWAASAPGTYQHVIWIWFENKSLSSVIGSPSAPYMTDLAKNECAYGTSWLDNVLNAPSEPNYVAATAGANCDSNTLHTSTPVGDRCVNTDGAPAASCSDVTCAGTVATSSIFEQLQNASKSWKAYQEGMPSNCSGANPSGRYYVKHNPPPFFSHLRIAGQFGGNTCSTYDIPFPTTACDGATCAPAASPNALADDLANGALPAFSFVTPDICNDMHDACSPYTSSMKNGDDWLAAWIPKIIHSLAYQAGTTAVLVMWDEGTFGSAQPNVVVAPSVAPGTVVGVTANNVAALRATEDMLGLGHLGCATGVQGDGSGCPTGSTADLRALFNI